ncbi:DUF3726 domain-containing protein [Granulosicoccus sp. 3-233]|uniref:DUF3726 domain-containing protein n=1 Tax=Granulosicoccus sp. 3-233 TaxID=3417969 RepID=UPI003D33182C
MNSSVNDPARSGPPLIVPPGTTLRLSRNEVESICTKAARGAGMSWGLAEEAGYAAGWLLANGHDGASMLARHLRNAQGKSWSDICPVVEAGAWLALSNNQTLCPIALGATLSDHFCVDDTLFDGAGLRVGEVSSPALVLPFLAMAVAARQQGISVRLHDDVLRMDVSGTVTGNLSTLLQAEQATLIIALDARPAIEGAAQPSSAAEPAPVAADALAFLHELSLRTTVPASAASRANAGAAGGDND